MGNDSFENKLEQEMTRLRIKPSEAVWQQVEIRIQKERMEQGQVPEGAAFFKQFGLNQERLAKAKSDAIVMHPGPMNRGVEIDSSIADGNQSVILSQVTFGIAIRMAVMSIVVSN